jgi:hypothetical protein
MEWNTTSAACIIGLSQELNARIEVALFLSCAMMLVSTQRVDLFAIVVINTCIIILMHTRIIIMT